MKKTKSGKIKRNAEQTPKFLESEVMKRTRAAVAYLNAGRSSEDEKLMAFLCTVQGWDADRAFKFVREIRHAREQESGAQELRRRTSALRFKRRTYRKLIVKPTGK